MRADGIAGIALHQDPPRMRLTSSMHYIIRFVNIHWSGSWDVFQTTQVSRHSTENSRIGGNMSDESVTYMGLVLGTCMNTV